MAVPVAGSGSPSPAGPRPRGAEPPPAAGLPKDRPAEESDPDDPTLVERVKAGETAAFEALMARYQALVSLVAFRQLGNSDQVEDVAQEAFVKAFSHIRELDDTARFKSWLLRIAANIALDHLRKRKHRGVSLDDTNVRTAAESATAGNPGGREDLQDAGTRALDAETRMQIVEAIYSLPEEYQIPAAMRYIEEVPYREISRRMGLREETLRKRIHRANQMLRRKLRKLWPEGQDL